MKEPTREELLHLLKLARDYWIANRTALLGIYALQGDATDEERPGLQRVLSYLMANGPCGSSALERTIRKALGEERRVVVAPGGEGLDEQETRTGPRAAKKEARVSEAQPIPMVLHCPECGEQHIDAEDVFGEWRNPVHRSHQCQETDCGAVWRPADVPTTGVWSTRTRGKADTYAPGSSLDSHVVNWGPTRRRIIVDDGSELEKLARTPRDNPQGGEWAMCIERRGEGWLALGVPTEDVGTYLEGLPPDEELVVSFGVAPEGWAANFSEFRGW